MRVALIEFTWLYMQEYYLNYTITTRTLQNVTKKTGHFVHTYY